MTTLAPNGDDSIIAAFMQQFEATDDKDAVVRRFAERHPELGPAFADYAAGHSVLKEAGPDGEPAARLLKPGELLGDFRVVRFIDHGGMGEIYEAEQVRLSRRRVALKVIRRGRAAPEHRARFLREQGVLAKLHQTNIVPVFAAGERGEVQYFAMQYIDGATLGRVVKHLQTRHTLPGGSNPTSSLAKLVARAVGPAPAATAPTATAGLPGPSLQPADRTVAPVLTDEYLRSVAVSLADVAEALHAAHEAGVVHRDVKPSNLMAEKSGKCWVIDFGLAGLVGESPAPADGRPAPADPALTATGSVMGTFAYMAPEQFGGDTDRRTDVWALGVTLYELLALKRPFPGPNADDYRRQIRDGEPADLRTVSRAIPGDLAAICRKAMRKSPSDRYPTGGEFAADLRRWLRHEPTAANPPWVWRRVAMWAHRQPGWASMVGVAMAALIGVAGLLLQLQVHKTAAANAETVAERSKAEAADQHTAFVQEAADQAARQRARQDRILNLITRARQPVHDAGWRDELLVDVRRLIAEQADPALRDRLASFLAGIDARPTHEFDEGVVRAVAFGPTDDRLLITGYGPPADERRAPRAHVRNLTVGDATGSSPGPVSDIAWRREVPVQLVSPITRPALEVWDMAARQRLDEFVFPEQFRPRPAFAQVILAIVARAGLVPRIVLPGPTVQAVAISADGTHAAALVRTAKGARSILVWRAGAPAPRAVLPTGAEDPVHFPEDIVLSPDGSLVSLGMESGRVRVWDVARGPRPVATLNVGNTRVTAMTFARNRGLPDAKRQHADGVPGWLLAAGDSGGELVVWELDRLEPVTRTHDSHHEVFALAFSPDAVTLYSAGHGEVRCWDVTTGRVLLHLHSKHGVTTALAVSPSGSRLGVAACNPQDGKGMVQIFELEPGRGIQTLRGLAGQVCRVTMTPDQRRLAAMTLGFQAGVWDRTTGQLLTKVSVPRAYHANHADLRLTGDGRFLVVASGEEARRYELPAADGGPARLTDIWKLPPAFSTKVGIAADGTIRIGRTETRSGTAYPDNRVDPVEDPRRVVIYRLPPGRDPVVIRRCDDHAWHVFEVCAAPDGSVFVASGIRTGDYGTTAVVAYAGTDGREQWRVRRPKADQDGGLDLDSSGRQLSYGGRNDGYWLRDLTGAEATIPWVANRYVGLGRRYCFVDPYESGLALARFGKDRAFLVLDPDQQVGHTYTQFSLDGQRLAWGIRDGTVKVADLEAVKNLLGEAGFRW